MVLPIHPSAVMAPQSSKSIPPHETSTNISTAHVRNAPNNTNTTSSQLPHQGSLLPAEAETMIQDPNDPSLLPAPISRPPSPKSYDHLETQYLKLKRLQGHFYPSQHKYWVYESRITDQQLLILNNEYEDLRRIGQGSSNESCLNVQEVRSRRVGLESVMGRCEANRERWRKCTSRLVEECEGRSWEMWMQENVRVRRLGGVLRVCALEGRLRDVVAEAGEEVIWLPLGDEDRETVYSFEDDCITDDEEGDEGEDGDEDEEEEIAQVENRDGGGKRKRKREEEEEDEDVFEDVPIPDIPTVEAGEGRI